MLLMVCVTVDYAENTDNATISNIENASMQINTSNFILINNSEAIYLPNDTGIIKVKKNEKIYTEKSKTKNGLITITSKPSCGCRYSYKWHTRTYINYCPNCHKYNTLRNQHKYPARFEQELTCSRKKGGCDSDFCGVCGKEKYSWSRTYLKKP